MLHSDPPEDHPAMLGHARAARFEAERLEEIALHTEIEALVAGMRHESAPLSRTAEARLELALAHPAGAIE